ncbi:MAG: hypothetical protein EXS43_06245 [Opitutus sp.]|nr:hypothetical protein [Opitutus sp.]
MQLIKARRAPVAIAAEQKRGQDGMKEIHYLIGPFEAWNAELCPVVRFGRSGMGSAVTEILPMRVTPEADVIS